MTIRIRTTALAVVSLLVPSIAAHAQSESYFERYVGAWEGGGSVQVEQLPAPVNVNCDATGGVEGETGFNLEGQCSAFLVLNNDIGADLTLDPETGVYTGVYTGSASGPADLTGTLEGDTLNLEVTWNKVIYDDDTARMTIENTDGETFVMQVTEIIDGEEVMVSDLTFERSSE